jgi:hypothetical protein
VTTEPRREPVDQDGLELALEMRSDEWATDLLEYDMLARSLVTDEMCDAPARAVYQAPLRANHQVVEARRRHGPVAHAEPHLAGP